MLSFTASARAMFAALTSALAIAAAPAAAQTYPSNNVKLIVPVPAGGVTDTMARIVAQRLSELWGQSVIVDNRPGGNYGVGAQAVSRSSCRRCERRRRSSAISTPTEPPMRSWRDARIPTSSTPRMWT